MVTPTKDRCRNRPWVAWALIVLPLSVALYSAYVTISAANEAEYDLHALICALNVTEEFVERNESWPGCWDDLARLADVHPPSMYRWPEQRAEVQERVTIDFAAKIEDLAVLPEPGQLPIRIRSTFYDLSHRSQSLHDTIRRIGKQSVETTDRPD